VPSTAPPFKQDPVDKAFAMKVDAVCQDWLNYASYHQYPGVADPQAATVDELSKIADWINTMPIHRDLVAKTTALGSPATGTAAWARVLADFASYQQSVAAAGAAARSGSHQAWKPAEDSWSAARDTVLHDLVEAGIGAQSPCSLLFARPAGHGN
jgi:hypothetical protein